MANGRGLTPEIPDPPGGIQGGEEAMAEEAPSHMRMGTTDDQDNDSSDGKSPSDG